MAAPDDPENSGQRLILNYAARGTAFPLDWKSATRGLGALILGLALSCMTMILHLTWMARVIEGFQKAEGQHCLWDTPRWKVYLKQVEGTELVPLGVMLAIAVLSTVGVRVRSRSGWKLAANILLHLAAVVLVVVLCELQRRDLGLYP